MESRIQLVFQVFNDASQHHFMGRPVLPALFALQRLATVVRAEVPGTDVGRCAGVELLRFLELPDARGATVVCEVELAVADEGAVRASLLTVRRVGAAGIRRAVEHVRAVFGGGVWGAQAEVRPVPGEPDGPVFDVTVAELYRELVPFGPAFQNARGRVLVGERGVWGEVCAPAATGEEGSLGSPFVLDAALHLCCAWGQRHTGAVAFPVGLDLRVVRAPTAPGEVYRVAARVAGPEVPGPTATLRFDIDVRDRAGEVRELARGVRMTDLSRGALEVPAWLREGVSTPGPTCV